MANINNSTIKNFAYPIYNNTPVVEEESPTDSLSTPTDVIHSSLPQEEVQKIAMFSLSAMSLKSEALENGELRVNGSPDQLYLLEEILGFHINPAGGVILNPNNQRFLASEAIYQLLPPEGKQAMGAALFSLLTPHMKFRHETSCETLYPLSYLRTFANQPITLSREQIESVEYLVINTLDEINDSKTFLISADGRLIAPFHYSARRQIHEGLVTLLWHNIPLLISEFYPARFSDEIAPQALQSMIALLDSLQESIKKAEQTDFTKFTTGHEACIRFVDSKLLLRAIREEGSTWICGQICPRGVTHLSPQKKRIEYVFCELHNPVLAPQDCVFIYTATTKPNELPQLAVQKSSYGRGHFSEVGECTLSFQAVPQSKTVQVTIKKENKISSNDTGSKTISVFTYRISLTADNKWEFQRMSKASYEEVWCERDHELKKNTYSLDKSYREDLDYIFQCLFTIYQIERSPYTLVMDHGGVHRVNNVETSFACLELYARINQGGTQKEYSRIEIEKNGQFSALSEPALTQNVWEKRYK